MVVKSFKISCLIAFLIIFIVITGCTQETSDPIGNDVPPSPTDSENDKMVSLDSLEIGDRVTDPSWTWEFRTEYAYQLKEGDTTAPVTWIVVAKDHYDTGGITLLSENLIGYLPFDTSSLDNGLVAGRNHWGDSGTGNAKQGIRPWLNSTGLHNKEGFYSAFSNDFKSTIIATEIPNKTYEDGTPYSTTDNVFIPSSAELGDTEFLDTYEVGSVYEYFEESTDDLRRAKIKDDNFDRNYWLRNPCTKGYRPVASVYEYGFFVNDFADFDGIGVRPVVNVSKDIKVSSSPNEEGIYIISYK